MAIKSDYISGTLTITQGSTLFTGTGTGWRSAEFKEGDTLIDITGATEYMGVIEAITGEATGTLTKPWEGPSLVNVPYRMRYQPDGARSTAQARNLIEILGNGNITAFALLNGAANLLPMFTGPGAMTLVTRQALVSGAAYDVQVATLADRAAYDGQDQGYAVLVSNIGDGRAAIYSKNSATSGDWSDPAYITGDVGPVVQIEAGTTTALPTGENATVVVRPITDGYALDFGLPRGLTGQNGTNGTNGIDGATGPTGPTGPRGEGLQIGATGTLAGRDAYDNEAEGFTYVDVELGNLYFRMGAPGNWSEPIPFGKGDKGDPGDSGATIVTTNGVGNGTAGPYTLTEAPVSVSATWASISGVTQYDFTLSGNQITFGVVIEEGIAWQVKSSGVLSVVEPADGSVGASKINTSESEAIRLAIGAASSSDLITSIANLDDVNISGIEDQNTLIWDANSQSFIPGEGGSGSGEPVGRVSMRMGALSPGCIAIGEGGVFSRSTFPELATWMDNYGQEAFGLTPTQILAGELPDWTGYSPRTIGGLGPATTGTKQEDAIQNITGGWGNSILRGSNATGAFAAGGPTNAAGVAGGGNTGDGFTFDASRVVRTATETRVKSFGVRWQIRAFGAIVDEGTINLIAIQQRVSDLESGSLRKDQDQNAQSETSIRKVNILKNTLQAWEQIGPQIRVTSATTTINWTNLSSYEILRLTGYYNPAIESALLFQQSSDNGGSFLQGSGDYVTNGIYTADASLTAGNTSAAGGYLSYTSVGQSRIGTIDAIFYAFNKNEFTHVVSRASGLSQAGGWRQAHSLVRVQSSAIANALRLIMATGNINTAQFTLEGIRG